MQPPSEAACLHSSGDPPASHSPLHTPPFPSPPQVAGGTWAYSLLLSSSQMARFAAPLCFNFLHVIRMNDLSKGQQVGHLLGAEGSWGCHGFGAGMQSLSQPLCSDASSLGPNAGFAPPFLAAPTAVHGVLPEDGRHEQRRAGAGPGVQHLVPAHHGACGASERTGVDRGRWGWAGTHTH